VLVGWISAYLTTPFFQNFKKALNLAQGKLRTQGSQECPYIVPKYQPYKLSGLMRQGPRNLIGRQREESGPSRGDNTIASSTSSVPSELLDPS